MTTEKMTKLDRQSGQRPRVYVSREANLEYGQLEKYGAIRFLTADTWVSFDGSIRNRRILTEMRENLRDYRPGVDWIASSTPLINTIVAAILAAGCGGPVQLLLWYQASHSFTAYSLDLGAIGQDGEEVAMR